MYFNRGSLPWQGLKAITKRQKYDRITERKISTPVDILCKGHPVEFAQYLNYCKGLRFEDKPDYAYLRKMFSDLFQREGFESDGMWEWNLARSGERENNNNTAPAPTIQAAVAGAPHPSASTMAMQGSVAAGTQK